MTIPHDSLMPFRGGETEPADLMRGITTVLCPRGIAGPRQGCSTRRIGGRVLPDLALSTPPLCAHHPLWADPTRPCSDSRRLRPWEPLLVGWLFLQRLNSTAERRERVVAALPDTDYKHEPMKSIVMRMFPEPHTVELRHSVQGRPRATAFYGGKSQEAIAAQVDSFVPDGTSPDAEDAEDAALGDVHGGKPAPPSSTT